MFEKPQELSYSTPQTCNELAKEAIHRYLSQDYEYVSKLPESLRIGKKTFIAAQRILNNKYLWFNDFDKTRFLLGKYSEECSYHDFWGILSNLWPREEAKVVSDLLKNAVPKLRMIVLLEVARSRDNASRLVADYLTENFTQGGWHHTDVEFTQRNKWSISADQRYAEATEAIKEAALMIAEQALVDLRLLSGASNFNGETIKRFEKISGIFQLSPIWNSEKVSSLVGKMNEYATFDNTKLSTYLAYRARLRLIHYLNNPLYYGEFLHELLNGIEDPNFGRCYASYLAIYAGKLDSGHLSNILINNSAGKFWTSKVFSSVINAEVSDVWKPWYNSPQYKAHFLLTVTIYLRCNPNAWRLISSPEVFQAKIRNFTRYIRRYEESAGSTGAIKGLECGQNVYQWLQKLENYSYTQSW
ncbi:MAG TPA: hypothetical protein VI953_04015 [Candidatus Paceibacterota bacterium]